MKKRIILVAILMLAVLLGGCREAEKVTYNLSKEADNFNVLRRLVVINTATGNPEFELIGKMSITADEEDDQLEVVVETEKGKYQKHIIGLNDATTMYVVEGISDMDVNKFKYEINYQPESIVPVTVTSSK